MKEIRTDEDVAQIEDESLRVLILARIEEYSEYVQHFAELVRFVVVGAGDQLKELEGVLGFGLASELSDASRGPDAYEEHPGYHELVYVLSDDGSGVIVFIEKGDAMAPVFMDLCRRSQVPESGP